MTVLDYIFVAYVAIAFAIILRLLIAALADLISDILIDWDKRKRKDESNRGKKM